jgi:hypothetical protein
VYLSHHYVIDLFAGALVAAASLAVMPLVHRAFGFAASSLLPAKGSQGPA